MQKESQLKLRIAGLSAEKRALLEQRLMEKRGAAPEAQVIPRRAAGDLAPLSFCQQRLWFLDQLTPSTSTYNVPNAMVVVGALNVAVLERCFSEVIRRHEVLRTSFKTVNGSPECVVDPNCEFRMEVHDLREQPSSEREKKAFDLLEELARRPFDLERAPMLRAGLVRLEDEKSFLLISTHHISWDAWSKLILTKEIAALYPAFLAGQPSSLPEPPIQYADFAAWQRRWLQGDNLLGQMNYWKNALAGAPAKIELPTDHPRPATQSLRGAKYPFLLPSELAEQAKLLSREFGVTVFMALLASFKVFLQSYTGQEDIVIGSPIAGRNRVQLESLIGFFINTLVLRTKVAGARTFREIVALVRESTLGAYAHQELPFDKLVEVLQPPRDLSRMTLFQVNFRVQTAASPPLHLPGLEIVPLQLIDTETSKFDLALELSLAEGFGGYIEYSTDLFEATTIAQMKNDYELTLAALLSNPNVPIRELESIQEIKRRKQMNQEGTQAKKSLGMMKRKSVDLAQFNPVTSDFFPSSKMPMVLRPATDHVELAEWAKNNRDYLQKNVLQHGAVLFRGFGLSTPEHFEAVASSICPGLFGEYGDLPREGVAGKVYGSTPYPSDQPILYHNESSHMLRWPMNIFFFCVTAAEKGGATPIVDCREVYCRLDPAVRIKFEEKGLLYVRNFSEGLDVSWQDFFHTQDKEEVEKSCRELGMECEWRDNNGLSIRQLCQGVARHPITGEMSFFNQVQLHHTYCLDKGTRESVRSIFKERDLPRHVYFGDGSVIEESVMDHVGEVLENTAVRFHWNAGDLIMLDNMLTAHARDPYVGARKIVVAMGNMVNAKDIALAATAVQA